MKVDIYLRYKRKRQNCQNILSENLFTTLTNFQQNPSTSLSDIESVSRTGPTLNKVIYSAPAAQSL